MWQLAEHVARKANLEDKCTGRFWEGRFKGQPLLDGAAILACADYVDLNPVRAKIAETPEESDYTVAKVKRSNKRNKKRASVPNSRRRESWLSPVYLDERKAAGPMVSSTCLRASDKGFLPIKLAGYLDLLDWTGRSIAAGKRGKIPEDCQPILDRIGLGADVWCELVENFGKLFGRFAGRKESLSKSAQSSGVS